MKLNLRKLSVAFVLAFSMFFVSACSLFTKNPKPQVTITNYSFQQGSVVFEREETFSLSGTKLTLNMSDNTSQTINLADAMIKSMPDMTTTGPKTVVITYEGKDYTITFVVVENKTDKYIQTLNDFLVKFNAGQKNVRDFEVYANAHLTSSFLGEEQTVSENAELLISQQEILDLLNSLEVSGATNAYNILINALVNASLTHTSTQAINLQQLTAQINPAALIGAIVTNVGASNVDDFLIEHVLTEYRAYFKEFFYQASYMIFEPLHYDTIDYLAEEMFYEVYHSLTRKIDINYSDLYSEMIRIIEEDKNSDDVDKDIYISFLTSFKNEQYLNSVSNLFLHMTKHTQLSKYTLVEYEYYGEYYHYWEYDVIKHEDETPEEKSLRENYMLDFAGLIKVAEDLYKTDFNISLNNLITHLTNLSEHETTLQEWEYEQMIADPITFESFTAIAESVKVIADKDFDSFDEKYGLSYILAVQMASALYDEFIYEAAFDEVVEELAELINNYLNSIISGEKINIRTLLGDLQDILENLQIEQFLLNLDEFNSPMYFTYVFKFYLDSGFEGTEEEREAYYNQFEVMFNMLEQLDLLVTFENDTINFNAERITKLEDALHDFLIFYEENSPELSDQEKELFDLALILVNSNVEYAQRVLNVISSYKQETAMLLTYSIIELFAMEQTETVYDEVYDWSEGFVYELLNDLVTLESSFTDLFDIVNEYGSEPNKTIALATLAMAAFFSDEDIDYNEMFASVELPPQIESIDYNKLVAKLKSENTYKVFELSNVEVKTVMNEQGEIIKEILTLTLNVDFDIMVTKTVGSISLNLEINY